MAGPRTTSANPQDEWANAHPARHVDPKVMRPGANVDNDGVVLPVLPSLMEAERRLLAADAALEERVLEYAALEETAAHAKADWEAHRDRVVVAIANSSSRSSADVRLAEAKLAYREDNVLGEDLYRIHLITAAAAAACGKSIGALQSRLSALQTLIRGLRQVTGFDS